MHHVHTNALSPSDDLPSWLLGTARFSSSCVMLLISKQIVSGLFRAVILKYHIFGHPRFLLRGRVGAQAEISLATMVYNLERINLMGEVRLQSMLTS